METDWRKVTEALTGPVPGSRPVWYQKHMTHHLLPEMLQRDWLSKLVHVFLIRDPAAVVASYLNKRDTVSAEDIGVPQQWALYRFVTEELGQDPPVIDSGEFLGDPEAHLRALCARLGIEFMRGHACLAARAARHRRPLGAALVSARMGIDRLRPAAGRAAGARGPSRRRRSMLPSGLRETAQTADPTRLKSG